MPGAGALPDGGPVLSLIERDTVWSGAVAVSGKVQIVKGATLTIQPGTAVRFVLDPARADASEDRIFVQPGATLIARGTGAQPIVFGPARPGAQWFGIELHSGHDRDVLEHCRVEGSRMGLTCVGASPRLERCVFSGNLQGVSAFRQAKPSIRACLFSDNDSGIRAGMQSAPTVVDCEITGSAQTGVAVDQDSAVVLEASRLSRNKVALAKRGAGELRASRCRFEDNETAITLDREGADADLHGNVFSGNRTAVRASARAALQLARNVFDGNGTAVRLDGRARGAVQRNDFTANAIALHLSRTSSPDVSRNRFVKNGTALLCEYSSYPTVAGNNFEDNGTDIRAGDNQSFEWTRSVWPPQEWSEWAQRYGRGKILAAGNYWGAATTRLMQAGATPLPTIADARASATLEVEGKSYRRDEVEFTPFRLEPVGDAGAGAGSTPPH